MHTATTQNADSLNVDSGQFWLAVSAGEWTRCPYPAPLYSRLKAFHRRHSWPTKNRTEKSLDSLKNKQRCREQGKINSGCGEKSIIFFPPSFALRVSFCPVPAVGPVHVLPIQLRCQSHSFVVLDLSISPSPGP